MAAANMILHATTVAVGNDCVAITGPSGSGKTSVALQCLAIPPGPYCASAPRLVADDQTVLDAREGALWASAPAPLKNMVEVRGLGVVGIETLATARLRCVVELTEAEIPRLPDDTQTVTLLECDIPVVSLSGKDPTTPLKALIWLAISHGRLPRIDTATPDSDPPADG